MIHAKLGSGVMMAAGRWKDGKRKQCLTSQRWFANKMGFMDMKLGCACGNGSSCGEGWGRKEGTYQAASE